MKNSTTLPLLISIAGLLFANQSLAITQSQMQMRVTATCDSYANFSRIANPDVIYGACITGARDAIQHEPLRFSWRVFCLSDQAATSRSFSEA